ncbi:MAG: hypothetical protein A2675_03945 [Candidatus Yonathbacteria bacterium RIFCSPHIGHO2_01_FULL_51_10]|uniref:Bacterial sugar transferase domain-containing protein n=1 Tax=Candidatus Yonathbacteria bacterium RIFCSPHIGHO2_01_FULL_51_10 TaxID=1802723 RepID=A0A1G2S5V0_9BACT|nr:MAG: hypothetical protein A2675_03945 [Candidatus Yonathbacteria bacterium RIFCSPHIGHO2_01_FULL_51_10]
MSSINKIEPLILLLGDLILFYAALWSALFLRHFEVPDSDLLVRHAIPFSYLFGAWVVVFFIAGLYEKHTTLFRSKLPSILLYAQTVNSFIAAVVFYLVPAFGIAPKTILFIYLIISWGYIFFWRTTALPLFAARRRQSALLIGSGSEMHDLKHEVNANPRYGLCFTTIIDLDKAGDIELSQGIVDRVYAEGVTTIVVDLKHPRASTIIPHLYELLFSGVKFVDMHRMYEDIFDRIPLTVMGYHWFLTNISVSAHLAYDVLKRVMDVVVAFVGGTASLVVYPFVALAIKIEDGGPLFVTQERVGQGNRPIHLIKFRSMRASDSGAWLVEGDSRVTRVGRVLRKTRIDELPQLWNVVRGDISLIGPRPDIIGLGSTLAKEISYYNIRYLIKPGLSGWAQIKQDLPPQSVEESKLRLAYDLFYIKNRSLFLDFKIALKTIKILLSRKGL